VIGEAADVPPQGFRDVMAATVDRPRTEKSLAAATPRRTVCAHLCNDAAWV